MSNLLRILSERVGQQAERSPRLQSKKSIYRSEGITTAFISEDRKDAMRGLLADFLGRGRKSEEDTTDHVKRSFSQEMPSWQLNPPPPNQKLDHLVPAARLALHEIYAKASDIADIARQVQLAVNLAAERISSRTQVSARDVRQANSELLSLISGKGPLQPLYDDPYVTEIFVDRHDCIRCIRAGKALETPFKFRSKNDFEAFCCLMLKNTERFVSATNPIVDCVLDDQWKSRVNIIHGSINGSNENSLAIRIPRIHSPSLFDLLRSQTLPAPLAAWLSEVVSFREHNILIVGPTGSGKTTMVTALLSAAGSDERICIIEEVPEINVSACQTERLLSRGAEGDQKGGIGFKELLQTALRRAPHRIIVGEIKDGEGTIFLEALETGHSGSIAAMHADNVVEGLWRLQDTIASSSTMPVEMIGRRIRRLIHLVICVERVDGKACVTEVAEVIDSDDMSFSVEPLVRYEGLAGEKRIWRLGTLNSPIYQSLLERGVELVAGPTLLETREA